MTVQQVSVFIENRKGRLGEVLSVLKANDINILSISLADTTEYGLLRLIVNDPNKAKETLTNNGFSALLTEVLVVKIPHVSGALQEILHVVASRDVNIEYMYGLSTGGDNASVVVKTNDLSLACSVLKENNIETMSAEEISKYN